MRKNWMRLAAAGMAVVMTAGMAACGSSGSSSSTTAAETTTAAAETTAAESKAEESKAEESKAGESAASSGTDVDVSNVSLNFWSDKVGSGSYNMIVAMSKILEEKGGFKEVNVDPS